MTTQASPAPAKTDQQLLTEYAEQQKKVEWLTGWREREIKAQAGMKAVLVERGLLPDESKLCPLCWPRREQHGDEVEHTIEISGA